jgi:hypothetical protein
VKNLPREATHKTNRTPMEKIESLDDWIGIICARVKKPQKKQLPKLFSRDTDVFSLCIIDAENVFISTFMWL